MAEVPYNPVQTQLPTGAATPAQHLDVSPDTFGASVGNALQRTGSILQDAQDRTFALQQHFQEQHNETVLRSADNELSQAQNDVELEFGALKGQDAVAAFPAYQQKIKDAREKVAQTIKNPVLRESFDLSAQARSNATLRSMGIHAADQADAANTAALKGSITAAQDRAVLHAGNSDVAPDYSEIVDATLVLAHKNGLPKEAADAMVQDNVGLATQQIIAARIASGHPLEAERLYQESLGKTAPGTDIPLLNGAQVTTVGTAVRQATENYGKDFLKTLTPQQAINVLKKDGKSGTPADYVSEGDRATLLRAYQKDVEAEYKAALAKQNERLSSDLAIKVGSGEATVDDVNNAFNKNIISGSQRASWINEINKTQDYRPIVLGALAGETILDPKDTKDHNAVSTYFDKIVLPQLAGIKPDEAKTVITQYVERTGIVPDTLRGQIRGGLRAGSPIQRANAADLIDRITDSVPQALNDFSADDIAIGKQIAGMVRDGIAPDRAVEMSEQLTKMSPEVIKMRKDALSANQGRLSNAGLDEVSYDAQGLSWFGRMFGTPDIDDAAKAEFRRDYERAYILTGDDKAARKTAASIVKRTWGQSEINGQSQLMKYAPETVYGVLDKASADAEWMRKQLLEDVKAVPSAKDVPPDNITLAPDAQTARDLTYMVMTKNANGEFIPLENSAGKTLRWRPDFKASPKSKDAEKRKKDAIEKARIEQDVQQELVHSPGLYGGGG